MEIPTEELQSVNERLYTVNREYQTKIEELTRLYNDVNNLLKTLEVGALYLDRNLYIRKINPNISKVTNILQSYLGRPYRTDYSAVDGVQVVFVDISELKAPY